MDLFILILKIMWTFFVCTLFIESIYMNYMHLRVYKHNVGETDEYIKRFNYVVAGVCTTGFVHGIILYWMWL